MFSCEIYETFKSTYFQEHQQSTASVCCEKLLFCMVLLISWGSSNSCNNFEYIQWSIINLMTNMLCTIIWLLSYMLVICSMTVSCIYKSCSVFFAWKESEVFSSDFYEIFWEQFFCKTPLSFCSFAFYENRTLGAGYYMGKIIPPRWDVSTEWDFGRIVYFTL